MRKNNTIYKHTFQTFIIFLLLLCMIPCLPADASPFETSVSVSDTDNDILSIETRLLILDGDINLSMVSYINVNMITH